MKITLYFFSFCFTTLTAMGQSHVKSIYYIYINSGDKMYNKVSYKHGFSMDYLCQCYANKKNLHFTYIDTGKRHISSQLPTKYYSMLEFAKVADEAWKKFQEKDFWNDVIYIVEATSDKSYCYYPVKFYPSPYED